MEAQLDNRYEALVRSHMRANHELAGGIKSKFSEDRAFNQTYISIILIIIQSIKS
jgi:hypothetical protein